MTTFAPVQADWLSFYFLFIICSFVSQFFAVS